MFLNINQIGSLSSMGSAELAALFIQEGCSVANSFVLMVCGAFAFQSAVYYVRNNSKYFGRLRWALILLAVFQLLLLPASLHHLVGVTFGWSMVDVYVGLSYLMQALLIVPSLLLLSQKIQTPQNSSSIRKWATIAAPLFVLALYFKYLFLWLDTLLPMGPQESTIATVLGEANCLVTLLFAGALTTIACIALSRNKAIGKPLAGVALIIVGIFFAIYTATALFVPVYASFWYLTDFWMLTSLILGTSILASTRH
jgi:hypothetical protein